MLSRVLRCLSSYPINNAAGFSTSVLEFPGFDSRRQIDESRPGFKPLWDTILKVPNVPDAAQKWVEAGNELNRELMTDIIHKLCIEHRVFQARGLAKWLGRQLKLTHTEKLLSLSILSYLPVRPDMRRAFKTIRKKTELAYIIILRSYCSRLLHRRAEFFMYELSDAGLMKSGRAYTMMLEMYARLGRRMKATMTCNEYQASGLPTDVRMYWSMIRYKDKLCRSLEVLEKVRRILPEVEMNDENRRELMKIHGALGNAEALEVTWRFTRSSPPVLPIDYLAAIEAYGWLGKPEDAEIISKELHASFGELPRFLARELYVVMVKMYSMCGLMSKAESIVDKMMVQEYEFDYDICDAMVDGYLKLEKFDEAVVCFKTLVKAPRTLKHSRKVATNCKLKLLRKVFAARGDVEGADELVRSSPGFNSTECYNTLIEVYRDAKVPIVSKRMKQRIWDNNLFVNDKTRFLLREAHEMVKVQRRERKDYASSSYAEWEMVCETEA